MVNNLSLLKSALMDDTPCKGLILCILWIAAILVLSINTVQNKG